MANSKNIEKIILVYNADNGFFNAVNDWAHKFFSPSTYQCSLCKYTYGLTGMLMPWKRFIESLDFPAEFLHRSEFRQLHPEVKTDLPAVIAVTKGGLEVLLRPEQISGSGELESLIQLTRSAITEFEARS